MCRVAPSHMKVLVCSSQDQERWPVLVCAQVLFVYHGYQRDFAFGWSLLPGSISTVDKLDPSSVLFFQVEDLYKVSFSCFIFCSVLILLKRRTS